MHVALKGSGLREPEEEAPSMYECYSMSSLFVCFLSACSLWAKHYGFMGRCNSHLSKRCKMRHPTIRGKGVKYLQYIDTFPIKLENHSVRPYGEDKKVRETHEQQYLFPPDTATSTHTPQIANSFSIPSKSVYPHAAPSKFCLTKNPTNTKTASILHALVLKSIQTPHDYNSPILHFQKTPFPKTKEIPRKQNGKKITGIECAIEGISKEPVKNQGEEPNKTKPYEKKRKKKKRTKKKARKLV
jgi:hypothetical protein